MSTEITWTWVPDGKGGRKVGETWNPQVGCKPISPGCTNCYAGRLAGRGMCEQHKGLTVLGPRGFVFDGTIKRVPRLLEQPLRWRKPRGVFVGSMTDLFLETETENARRWIAAIFGVMAACPQHTFMVLTKRPGNMREWFEWVESQREDEEARGGAWCWTRYGAAILCREAATKALNMAGWSISDTGLGIGRVWPLPNVWIGTTVEDQQRADERIPELLACPAAVRFLSCEPLLGAVDLRGLAWWSDMSDGVISLRSDIDWIVCGGESGPGARPMHPGWARELRDQCAEAGVPLHFKQWGAWAEVSAHAANDVPGRPGAPEWTHMVAHDSGRAYARGEDMPLFGVGRMAYMRRVGKRTAGRELDGRTWDEFPS